VSSEPEKIYDSDPSEDTSWMLTYGDIITLLMIFFVLMFSSSKLSEEKFDKVAQSINESLNRPGPDPEADPNQAPTIPPLRSAQTLLDQMIKDRDLEMEMETTLTPSGLMIELSSNSFFQSGSADIKPTMIKSLVDLGQVIQDFPTEDYQVDVEGHTDNVPINTVQFPSNWELSALRAVNVAHIFEDNGMPRERIAAIAYADTKPKKPNTDEAGINIPENQAENRRVVVFVSELDEDVE
jgi:chemotaxis protein MotB